MKMLQATIRLTCLIIFSICTKTLTAQVIQKQEMLQFKGKIAAYPITLKLTADHEAVRGVYYYDKVQQPIFVIGQWNNHQNKISLQAYVNPAAIEDQAESFELISSNGGYVGDWTGGKNKSPLPVALWKDSTSIAFVSYSLADSIKLFPKLKNSPGAHFNASIVWPDLSTPLGAFIKKEILHYSIKSSSSIAISDLLRRISKDFLLSYKQERKDVAEVDVSESSWGYDAERSIEWRVQFESARILSLSVLNYEYSGGAHGFASHDFLNIDKIHQKPILIGDVLKNPQSKQILKLLERRYRIQLGIPQNASLSDAGLFEDEIKALAEVFYITDKGIGFVYDQYEIAPYAAGSIDIFVPFSDLKALLTPEFLQYAR